MLGCGLLMLLIVNCWLVLAIGCGKLVGGLFELDEQLFGVLFQ
jgi:hypothetical protein